MDCTGFLNGSYSTVIYILGGARVLLWIIVPLAHNAYKCLPQPRRHFGCIFNIQSRWGVGKSLRKLKAQPWAMRQQSRVDLGLLFPPPGPEPASKAVLPLTEVYFLTQGLVIKGIENMIKSLKCLNFKLLAQMGYVWICEEAFCAYLGHINNLSHPNHCEGLAALGQIRIRVIKVGKAL